MWLSLWFSHPHKSVSKSHSYGMGTAVVFGVVGAVVGKGVGWRGCLKQTMEFGLLSSKQHPVNKIN